MSRVLLVTTDRQRVDEIYARHESLRNEVSANDDDWLARPSRLPGWSRKHVISHLGLLAAAFARQVEFGLRGDAIDVYDGGRAARNEAIEALASSSSATIAGSFLEGLAELEVQWAGLGPDQWSIPSRYRDSDLRATQMCWWRESGLHAVDLIGQTSLENLSRPLAVHIVDYLMPRIPPGTTSQVSLTDGSEEWAGPEAGVQIAGSAFAVAGWISGRRATEDSSWSGMTSLPRLSAWP